VPHIVDMFKDSNSWNRYSAVTALGEISKQQQRK